MRLRAVLVLAALALSACGITGPKVANHAFGFDVRNAIPAVEILDYRYGQSTLPVRAPEWAIKEGRPIYFNGVSGPMRVGDDLYVKWRIKESGQIHEDTVDLRRRLPADLENQEVYFDIGGPQLYVYLISQDHMPPNANPCPSRDELKKLYKSAQSTERIFARFCYRKLVLIYPDKDRH